ncbi:hypothetical protein AYI68_g5097 [Smittium mucronatum]|uniref:Uncharacterized protein n=1 Tax=Smittium mucronatum TaxID=133383 RepID=A0A1R0GV93_9FUNG|nr:hypothetical protein AYI68_g5097 [Smittium mucronatum]
MKWELLVFILAMMFSQAEKCAELNKRSYSNLLFGADALIYNNIQPKSKDTISTAASFNSKRDGHEAIDKHKGDKWCALNEYFESLEKKYPQTFLRKRGNGQTLGGAVKKVKADKIKEFLNLETDDMVDRVYDDFLYYTYVGVNNLQKAITGFYDKISRLHCFSGPYQDIESERAEIYRDSLSTAEIHYRGVKKAEDLFYIFRDRIIAENIENMYTINIIVDTLNAYNAILSNYNDMFPKK